MAKRRKKPFRIRFKKKFPFVKFFGSSPVEHVRKLRRSIGPLNNTLDTVMRWAGRGQCTDAVEAYGNAQYLYGGLHAHAASTSSKTYSGDTPHLRRVNFTPIARKMIAARKAVEACIVKRR